MDNDKKEDYILQYYTVIDQDTLLQESPIDELIQSETEVLQQQENKIIYITLNSDSENTESNSTTNLDVQRDAPVDIVYPSTSNVLLTLENGQIYIAQNFSTDFTNDSDLQENIESETPDDDQSEANSNLTTVVSDFDNNDSLPEGSNYQEIQLEDGTCAVIDSDLLKSIIENSNSSKSKSNDSSKGTTKVEEKKKTWPQKWVCKYNGCGKMYSNSHHLSVHNRIHTGSRPFKCIYCNKSFTTGYSLKSHQRIHTGETPYPCKFCPKEFKTSGDLQKHNRVHTGEKPFMCPIKGCGKSFTTSNIRKVHVRSHTGERPYICSTCGKGFASATNYKNHVRIHSGEKPYVCSVPGCGRCFTEYSSLYKHKYVHQQAKPFVCSYCSMSFKHEHSLKTHKIGEHDIIFGPDGKEIVFSQIGLKFEPKKEDDESQCEEKHNVL